MIDEDYDEVVHSKVDPAELLAKMYASIAVLQAEAAERARFERERQVEEERNHPEAPHAMLEWRKRSRSVFVRLRAFGFSNMPWHHPEIWEWAAVTEAGQKWLESEIAFWEVRAESFEMRKRFTENRLLEEGCILSDGRKSSKHIFRRPAFAESEEALAEHVKQVYEMRGRKPPEPFKR